MNSKIEALQLYIRAAKRHFQEEIEIREKTKIHELAVKLEISEDEIRKFWEIS